MSRLALLFVLCLCLAHGFHVAAQTKGDIEISVAPTASGGLRIQGKGGFKSGESVTISLYFLQDDKKTLKVAEQFDSRRGSFDATLKPGKLVPGKYIVEVTWGSQVSSVCVSIETFESVARERGEEEEKFLGHWKRVSLHAAKLVQMHAPGSGYRGTYYGWEKEAIKLDEQLVRARFKYVVSEQEKLRVLLGRLIALCRLCRGALSDQDGYLKKYGVSVVKPDGQVVAATALIATCKQELSVSFKGFFRDTVRTLLERLEDGYTEMFTISSKTKRLATWESTASTWRGLVEALVDRHLECCERSVLYSADTDAVIAAIGAKMCSLLAPTRALLEKKNEQAAVAAKEARLKELNQLLEEFESGKKK